MKKLILTIVILVVSGNFGFSQVVSNQSNGQETGSKSSKYMVGFNLALPMGIQPSTALTDASFGTSLEKSYSFGIIIQRELKQNFSLFFDINMYNYNNFLASQGSDVQSSWTLAEGATHWDEPGAPQILYVSNLPTDVHFDMQTTGFRLGAKYIFGDKKIKPWAGAAFGFYYWKANYFNEDKSQTYGSDSDYVFGPTILGGIDFKITEGIRMSAFADLLSPVAVYTMEGLFYPQWNITDWDSPIFGQYRIGITLWFTP